MLSLSHNRTKVSILMSATECSWFTKYHRHSYGLLEHNPADQATRPFVVENMKNSRWFYGPKRWLLQSNDHDTRETSNIDKQFADEYGLVMTWKWQRHSAYTYCKDIGTERFTKTQPGVIWFQALCAWNISPSEGARLLCSCFFKLSSVLLNLNVRYHFILEWNSSMQRMASMQGDESCWHISWDRETYLIFPKRSILRRDQMH